MHERRRQQQQATKLIALWDVHELAVDLNSLSRVKLPWLLAVVVVIVVAVRKLRTPTSRMSICFELAASLKQEVLSCINIYTQQPGNASRVLPAVRARELGIHLQAHVMS
ncbi:unnamed protein product [Polarella glacialis]|uniref:Uncharacterized protein n=1 Tax=Polarella glacialis TaxID=89957 RepID=A0A813I7C0_POLGL|nr:unnamed protein product [Polarella glacialis]